MKFEFDDRKSASNLEKHGVALDFGAVLVWDEALVWVDERFEYGELRMVGLVPHGNTLYYVAFADRGDVRRLISIRKALRKEVKHYVEHFQ